MDEITTQTPPDYLKVRVEAVNRAKDETAYSVIRLGQRLVELKDDCKHGEFTKVAEECCGLKKSQCCNLMRIYQAYGQKCNQLHFSPTVLIELSRADDPQEALAEAEKMEDTLTAKQAKEIVELQRLVAEEKAKREAQQSSIARLIPELERLHRFGEIPEKTALEFSKLDEGVQRLVVLPKFQDVKRLRQDIEKLNAEKNRALEKESKAREESEALKHDLTSAIESGTEELLRRKDEEIARKEMELNQLKIDMRDKIEREQTEILRKRFKEEHAQALLEKQKEIEKLTRKLATSEDHVTQCTNAELFERAQKEKAQAQLAATGPMEKDAYHARKIRFIVSDVKAVLEKIESDCEPYQRQQSAKELRLLLEMAQRHLGTSFEIIDI